MRLEFLRRRISLSTTALKKDFANVRLIRRNRAVSAGQRMALAKPPQPYTTSGRYKGSYFLPISRLS